MGGEAVSTTRRHGANADMFQILVWSGYQTEAMLKVGTSRLYLLLATGLVREARARIDWTGE